MVIVSCLSYLERSFGSGLASKRSWVSLLSGVSDAVTVVRAGVGVMSWRPLQKRSLSHLKGSFSVFSCETHHVQSEMPSSWRPTAGQAHWQAGIIEKQEDPWKELWRRVVEEKSIESSDVPVATAAVNSAKNELRRVSGFSPTQIAFGQNPRLPEDLIDNTENLGANYLLTTDLKRQREVAISCVQALS